MKKIIVDGKNKVLGRLGSSVSKELLKGNSVDIINSEEVLVSGNIEKFVERIKILRRKGRGGSLKGPKYIRKSDLLLKRMIRGMLPWDKPKGREAHKRLKCYIGEENEKKDKQEELLLNHKIPTKYFKLKEAVKYLK